MKSKKIEVTEIAIADLVSDDKNANMHTEAGDKLTYKSISELGLLRSGGVDANNMLIAGNGVKKQALLAGKTKALIVDIDEDTWVVTRRKDLDLNDPGESGRKARQMALVDNASALAGIEFDIEAVQEIEEKWGFEAVDWGVEFPEEEKEVPAAEEDEGAGALPSHPVTVKGDVWELISEGKKLRHRVMCGDSTDSDAVGSLMGGQKADMVFTDPPYGVDYSGGIQFKDGEAIKGARTKLANDDSEDIYRNSLTLLPLFTSGPIYTWFAGTKAKTIYSVVAEIGDLHAMIVWVKNGGYGALNANYKQKHEPCLYWKPKGGRLNFIGETTETTIWEINKDGRNEFHPTQKPIALAAKAIANHDAPLVLDIFLGSGTTLIACEQLNRNCYGMELDEKYCDVIVRRWIAQMEKDGAKWKVLLNGEERTDMVAKLLEQGN